MDVSALLAQYLSLKSQISYNQLEETRWANLHENMSKKVSEQTSYQSKWDDEYDSAETKLDDTDSENKSLVVKGHTFHTCHDPQLEATASAYASLKVPKYNPEQLEEYMALDIEYDMMQTTYDTLLEELQAQADAIKTTLDKAASDTGGTGSQ